MNRTLVSGISELSPDDGSVSSPISLRTRFALALGVSAFTGFAIGGAAVYWLRGTTHSVLVLACVGLVVSAVTTAVGALYGGRVATALERMVSWTERVAEGEYDARPDISGPAEVRRVGENVAAMAEQLIEHQEQLRRNVESLENTNRALLKARDELVRAEKLASVGRLASGIAHEVGNPLSSIMSVLELLRKQADDSLVDHLESEAHRIDEIINGLFDFARPGEAPVTATDPRKVVEDTIELLRIQGRFEAVTVDVEGGSGERLIEANPDHLQQVLVNLLLNAADASAESDGQKRVLVHIRTDFFGGESVNHDYSARRSDDPEGVDYSHLRRMDEPPGQFREFPLAEGDEIIRIEVLDSGPGIGEQEDGRIFDPFFTTKEPGEGMGLGLAIAARLTDQMGGVIEAHGRPEGGSVFAVLLPVTEDGGQG